MSRCRHHVVFNIVGVIAIVSGTLALSGCQSSGNNNATPIATSTHTSIPTLTIVTPTPGQPGGSVATQSSGGAVQATQTPTQPNNGQNGRYTVQAGDTLYNIAVKFNVTIQALMQANSITNPASLQAGQVLVIP